MDHKIISFSISIDNNLDELRSIIHDKNFIVSYGRTITVNITYDDGSTETSTKYYPEFKTIF